MSNYREELYIYILVIVSFFTEKYPPSSPGCLFLSIVRSSSNFTSSRLNNPPCITYQKKKEKGDTADEQMEFSSIVTYHLFLKEVQDGSK